jgi:heme-degrading monooxygenase HmoA
VPVLKRQKGFKNLYVMVNRRTGKTHSISLWESQADAQAFGESEEQKAMEGKMAAAGGGPSMDWDDFEVIVQA